MQGEGSDVLRSTKDLGTAKARGVTLKAAKCNPFSLSDAVAAKAKVDEPPALVGGGSMAFSSCSIDRIAASFARLDRKRDSDVPAQRFLNGEFEFSFFASCWASNWLILLSGVGRSAAS